MITKLATLLQTTGSVLPPGEPPARHPGGEATEEGGGQAAGRRQEEGEGGGEEGGACVGGARRGDLCDRQPAEGDPLGNHSQEDQPQVHPPRPQAQPPGDGEAEENCVSGEDWAHHQPSPTYHPNVGPPPLSLTPP